MTLPPSNLIKNNACYTVVAVRSIVIGSMLEKWPIEAVSCCIVYPRFGTYGVVQGRNTTSICTSCYIDFFPQNPNLFFKWISTSFPAHSWPPVRSLSWPRSFTRVRGPIARSAVYFPEDICGKDRSLDEATAFDRYLQYIDGTLFLQHKTSDMAHLCLRHRCIESHRRN